MANITLNIPDAQLPRVIEALCNHGLSTEPGWPPAAVEATPANAKAVVVGWVKGVVSLYELNKARQAVVPPTDIEGIIA